MRDLISGCGEIEALLNRRETAREPGARRFWRAPQAEVQAGFRRPRLSCRESEVQSQRSQHGVETGEAGIAPAREQPYSGKKHTDDVSDAYFLAELLRLKLLPTGHIADRATRPVWDLMRRRQRQRTTLILSFKSLHDRTLGQRLPLARVKAMEPAPFSKGKAHKAIPKL